MGDENKTEITEESVQAKVAAGDELTKEETKFVMSSVSDVARDGANGVGAESEDDDDVDYDEDDDDDNDDNDNNADSGDNKDGKKDSSSEDKDGKEEKKEGTDDADAGKDKSDKDKKPEEEENLSNKLEVELGKPDGQEDLGDFSKREKGLFYQMKEERRKRQDAEADRDVQKLERVKDKKHYEAAAKSTEDTEEVKAARVELDKLYKGDEDDEEAVFTKKEMRRIKELEDVIKKGDDAKSEAKAELDNQDVAKENIEKAQNAAVSEIDRRRKEDPEVPEFDKVMSLGEQIIENNDAHKTEIARQIRAGKNPALVIYDLIVADPKFKTLYKPGTAKKEPEKKEDKKKAAKKTNEKINKNLEKPNTSGKEGGGDGDGYKDDKGNVYTEGALMKMSSMEFRSVPKKVREKFLKDMND